MRRALVLTLAIVVISTACGSSGGGAAAPAPSTKAGATKAGATEARVSGFEIKAPALTDVQQILAGQTTDQLPTDKALQLFVLAFGPVPGVTVHDGPKGALPSGTLALEAVSDHWADLSDEQRSAISDLLGTDPATPPTQSPTAGHRGRSAATTPDDSDGPGAEVYRSNLDQSLALLEARLGPLGGAAEPIHVQLMVHILDPSNVNARALAWTARVRPDLCRVTINPTRIGDLRGPSLPLVHELFHCYQGHWRNGRRGQPIWVREGLANWVAASTVAGTGAADEGILYSTYQVWQESPTTPLFERNYDAVGFFSLVEQSIPNLIRRVQQITVDDTNEQAYADSVNGVDDLLDRWGARQFDLSDWGPDWDLAGPGVPALVVHAPGEFGVLGNGASDSVESTPFASKRSGVSITAEIAEIDISPGTGGTVRLDTNSERLSAVGGQWCTGTVCVCPPETVQAGREFPQLRGAEHMAIAIAAGPAAGSVTIRGRTLLEVCGEQQQCYVGRFTMAPISSEVFQTISGGGGATLDVAADGTFTIDLSTMSEWVAAPTVDTTMENHVRFGGQITGRLGLPTTRTDPATLDAWDAGSITGQLSAYLHGNLVMTMDEETARQFAAGFGNPTGRWSVTPCTDTGFTFSNSGTSFVWAPA